MTKLPLFFLLIFFSIAIFVNLGKFVDVTQKPIKVDIIVALGGDQTGSRLIKALGLYKEGYSKSGKFIYTGTTVRKGYLENKGILKQNIIPISGAIVHNTMEEVLFIKQYMLKHHYKSVIFVSHPQHSRRIVTLANSIAGYKDAGLDLIVASIDTKYWNKDEYYKSIRSVRSTIYEIVKLFFNLVKYNTPLIQYTEYSKKIQNGEWETALERLDNRTHSKDNRLK